MINVIRATSFFFYINVELTVAVSATDYRRWEEWTDFQEILPAVRIPNSLLPLNLCLVNPALLIVNTDSRFPATHFFITFMCINKSLQ